MKAFYSTEGSLCIDLGGTSCVRVDTSKPNIAKLRTEDHLADEACVFGYAFGVGAVEITLASGGIVEERAMDHPAFEVDFYAYCGVGDLRPLEAALPEDTQSDP